MKNALAAVSSMRPTPTDRIVAIILRPAVLKIITTTKVRTAIPAAARINAVGSHSVASHGAVKREPKKLATTKRLKSPAIMALLRLACLTTDAMPSQGVSDAPRPCRQSSSLPRPRSPTTSSDSGKRISFVLPPCRLGSYPFQIHQY